MDKIIRFSVGMEIVIVAIVIITTIFSVAFKLLGISTLEWANTFYPLLFVIIALGCARFAYIIYEAITLIFK